MHMELTNEATIASYLRTPGALEWLNQQLQADPNYIDTIADAAIQELRSTLLEKPIEFLLDNFPQIAATVAQAKDSWGTALQKATNNNFTTVAQKLIAAGADVNAWVPRGYAEAMPPLSNAARNGNKELVSLLLAKNADPNGAAEYHSALAQAKDCPIVQLLLAYHAQSGRITAFNNAAQRNDLVCAQILINAGANALYTPLTVAPTAAMAEFLLSHGSYTQKEEALEKCDSYVAMFNWFNYS